MSRCMQICLGLVFLAGCAHNPTRNGVLSQDLPLTLDDLSEIRAGEKNHEKVLWEYRVYKSPKLEKYCNGLAAHLAAVSTRPHLPYHVVLLDHNEVNIFGGPGGYIYITRGFFDFVQSESELAGAIAHEITHVANYEYSNIPHVSKAKSVYDVLLKGTDIVQNTGMAGPYGKAANMGMRGLGKAAPVIAKRFTEDQEVATDGKAIDALVKAGYDPHGYANFVERLAHVGMEDVGRFVILLNTHPPFQDRRNILQQKIQNIPVEKGDVSLNPDLLTESRQETIDAPDSIVFQPQFGNRDASLDVQQMEKDKQEKFAPDRKRLSPY